MELLRLVFLFKLKEPAVAQTRMGGPLEAFLFL